jgi:dTDP-4-dehydro-6-deoxy-alpha-D-glucopyranose 2,3-dehydratase
MSNSIERSFLRSALTVDSYFFSLKGFMQWFNEKNKAKYYVERIPFQDLSGWYFEEGTENLVHSTGNFFRICGLSIETTYPEIKKWQQPIILQPEIGILGILTKVIDGIRYFLMQAKMEPGNVNLIQISPTVQATRSNYTQKHGGKLPDYLEYFIDESKSTVIFDQLQSEQGARFLGKRNRNVIIDVKDDVKVLGNFCWLTLGQIKKLLEINNIVNMDSRTVLSTIQYTNEMLSNETINELIGENSQNFQRELFLSIIEEKDIFYKLKDTVNWFAQLKSKIDFRVIPIALNTVKDWGKNEFEIFHKDRKYFSVIGVSIEADGREVTSWKQPLLEHFSYGVIGFIISKIKGTLHFLVNARMEPGYIDVLELGPTVAFSNAEERLRNGNIPLYGEFFCCPKDEEIRFSTIHSEEGGRFLNFQNRYMIIEKEACDLGEIPNNYRWMTLGQLLELIKHPNYINVEARCLLSCISFL